MNALLRDGTLEKGEVKGAAKVSRRDGMTLSAESELTLVLRGKEGTPLAGVSAEQSQKSTIARRGAAAHSGK